MDDSSSLWCKLWRIKAPPKSLNLTWRALAYCLPTMTMLSQKHVPVLCTCPVCNEEDETIMHAMLLCPFATQCWHSFFPDIQQERDNDFYGWLNKMFNDISSDRRALVVTVCWAIWRARNEKHWNHKQASMNVVLASAKQYLVQWQNAQGRSTQALVHSKVEGDGAISWVKPQTDNIKVTVDAAVFREHTAFGMGMIARDDKGELVQAKSLLQNGVVSPELAEAMTIKEALSWIKTKPWNQVVIETDCLAVVQAVRSKISMSSPFGAVIEECKRYMVELNKISLFFIRRSANMAAHYLAKESRSHPGRVIDGRNVLVDLMNILLADLS